MARRRSRPLKGLGDTPKGHANKAFNLANSAIRSFKQAVQPGKSCKAAFALYTNGAITMGESMGHILEASGGRGQLPELEKASEKAYAAIRGCLSDGSLSGLKSRRRRSRK